MAKGIGTQLTGGRRYEKDMKIYWGKSMTDRERVTAWLAEINETDPACIAAVMEQCSTDPEARAYYSAQYQAEK